MSTAWEKVERFTSDEYSYESSQFTYGGWARIHICLPDAEGAAISLQVSQENGKMHHVDLTAEEAREIGDWLAQAAYDVEQERATA